MNPDDLKKTPAKELRDRLDLLAWTIDDAQNEAELIIEELKRRGLKT